MSKLSAGIIGGVLATGAAYIIGWAYKVGKEEGEKELLGQLTIMAKAIDNVKKQ